MHRLFVVLTALAALLTFGVPPATSQPQPADAKPRLDSFGDPLPEAALARIGTTRFRHRGMELLGFTPDGKAVIYHGNGSLRYLDAAKGTEIKTVHFAEGDGRFMTGLLSGDTKVLAVSTSDPFGGLGGALSFSILLIDTDTGKERKRLEATALFKNAPQSLMQPLALTDDGKWLLVSSGRGFPGGGGFGGPKMANNPLPLIWVDTTTGQVVHEIQPSKDCMFVYAQFSHDGKKVVVAERTNVGKFSMQLRIIDGEKGRDLQTIPVPGNNPMFTFQLRPDGKTLLVDDQRGGPVRLYDYASDKEMKEVRAFSAPAQGPNGMGTFMQSRDGKHLFIAGVGRVQHWDIDGGKEQPAMDTGPLQNMGGGIPGGGFPPGGFGPGGFGPGGFNNKTLAVSHDGKSLAASGTQTFSVFDTVTGKKQSGSQTGSALGLVRFHPDGKSLITVSTDHQVQQWEVPAAKLQRTLEGPKGLMPGARTFGHAAFSKDGKLLAVNLGLGDVGLWDAVENKFLRKFEVEQVKDPVGGGFGGFGMGMPASFAFTPNGKVLAVGFPTGSIKLFDTANGQVLRSWAWQEPANPNNPNRGGGSLLSLAFSADGKTLAGLAWPDMNSPPTSVVQWETSTGQERLRLRLQRREDYAVMDTPQGVHLEFAPDGKTLNIALPNALLVLDALSGKDVATYASRRIIGATATFSADGKWVFVGLDDGTLRVLDRTSGKPVRDFQAHSEQMWSLALSPDGKVLASASVDSTALLWDVAELTKPAAPAKAAATAKELDALWQSLADKDSGRAFKAVAGLVESGGPAVTFLAAQIKPVTPADAKLLEHLLDDLDSDQYKVRDKATTELTKLGELAAGALRQRLKANPPQEMRQRIEKLLAKVDGPVQTPAVLQVLRGIEALERIGTREALEALTALAKGAAGHRITEDAREAAERLASQLKTP
jgi:WD40 repeat protein